MTKKKEILELGISDEEVKRVERLKEILLEIKDLPTGENLFVGFDAPKKLEALRKEYVELSELINPLKKLEGTTTTFLDGFGIQVGKFSLDLGKVANQLNNLIDGSSYLDQRSILAENIRAELLALENKKYDSN